MLLVSYLGIAFAVVFYLVFGIAVRLMDLNAQARNKAHLLIVIVSISIGGVSFLSAGITNLVLKKMFPGVLCVAGSFAAFFILVAILVELHHITTKVKMRRFMVLFDIVDRYIQEGKTQDEILHYLIQIQKLTRKEAVDFLTFISDPTNHEFLADVNSKIQEAKLLGAIK